MNETHQNAVTTPTPANVLESLRRTFQEVSSRERFAIRQELVSVMVSNGEAADNRNALSVRMTVAEKYALKRLADGYATSVSALIRDSVRHYVNHELPKRRMLRQDGDHGAAADV